MDRGFDIPWVRGSIYHGHGAGYTMGREFDISWVGSLIYHRYGVRYIMDRGSIYHG